MPPPGPEFGLREKEQLILANEALEKEVSEHRRTEALLDGQRRVLEMMATGAPLSETLRALVLLIEAHVPGMLGSILLLDEKGVHLRHGAAPSLPPDYVKAIDGGAIGPYAGSCGTAAYCKEPVIVEDIASDPHWEQYRALALPHGLRACWSTPIFDARRHVLGTFAMYYRQPALPQPEHLRLIEMATHMAALAIGRERSQAVLRDSEARLKEAQRLANIGYFDRDLIAGRITWSEATGRIFGLPPKARALSEAELREMIHPDDRELQRRALDEAVRARQPYDVEFRIIRPDGEVRFVHVRDATEYDASGRAIRIFGTVQDITERKRTEQAVRESKQLLDLVLTTLPVGVAVTDRAGDIILANEASKRIWGDMIAGGPDRWGQTNGYWHDSRRKIEANNWASVRALSRGQTSLNELIDIVTYDGRERTIQNTAAPIRDAEGLIVGAVIVNEDVTERVRAEELLRAREEEIRAVVENSPDLIVRFDRELRRTYVNPAFVKAIELPKEDLLGKEIGSAAKDGDTRGSSPEIAVVESSLRWVRENCRPIDFECAWPMTGGQRVFSVHMEPEFDAAVALTSILVISRDISEIKAGQEKLRQMETDLAHVSRLTTMGELAVAIAHEINQPLTALATNANAALRWLAAKPPHLDEARRAVQHVVGDATWAGEVIARIRSLLKKGEPIRAPLDLHEVVEKTLALAQPELARHKVSVQTDLDANLPRVEADPVQLQQVLLNLLINAVDSLRSVMDRPRLLRIGASHDEPRMVRVSVRDSGVGIDPEHADRLFQAFFTTKPDGFGMGLAISYSIIEAHGGRLWMTPNDGPGVTFHFTLPVPSGGAT